MDNLCKHGVNLGKRISGNLAKSPCDCVVPAPCICDGRIQALQPAYVTLNLDPSTLCGFAYDCFPGPVCTPHNDAGRANASFGGLLQRRF